jgi:hypothetical protein
MLVSPAWGIVLLGAKAGISKKTNIFNKINKQAPAWWRELGNCERQEGRGLVGGEAILGSQQSLVDPWCHLGQHRTGPEGQANYL